MDMEKVGAEVFSFMKTSYFTTLGTITVIQDQAGRALNTLMESGKATMEGGRSMMSDWEKFAKKNREEYQKMIEENLKKAEDFFFRYTFRAK